MDRQTLSVLAALGTLLGAMVCALSAYLFGHIPLIWKISGGCAFVLAIFYGALEFRAIGDLFSKRSARYGLNSIIMSLLGLAILIIVNMIVVEYDWKVDLTKNKLHSLSEESLKVLKNLKSEVIIKAFIYPTQMQEFDRIFDKYSYYSKLLKKEYVDLDKDPLAVQSYNIKSAGTLVVESMNRTARIENLQGPDDPKLEEKITNAIIQVAKGEKRKIYFISGHGERLIGDSGRDGYSELKEILEGGRYRVEELTLLEKEKIPQDADIVVCAAPRSEFMKHEVDMVDRYLQKGGKALFLLEAHSPGLLKEFLAKYGVDWRPKKTVYEANRLQQLAGGNPLAPIVTSYDSGHEITQELKQLSIFPIPTPVEKAQNPPPNFKVNSLFSSSTRSLEVDLLGDKVKVDQAKDRKGPISLAVASLGKFETNLDKTSGTPKEQKQGDAKEEKKDVELRLIVVGDADFASNGMRKFGVNSDLFQNMLSWLAKEEDLISIRPKASDTSEFEITEARIRFINLASVIVAPFGMFLAGIAVWLKRKNM